jgi:hypothetical protein
VRDGLRAINKHARTVTMCHLNHFADRRIVPSAFDTCVKATSRVREVSNLP